MNKISRSHIDNLINQGFKFDFGNTFSEGYELFKKDVGTLVLGVILSGVVSLFLMITILGIFALPPLFFGLQILIQKIDSNESYSVSSIFDGYKKFSAFFKYALVWFGILIVPYILMTIVMIPSIITENLSNETSQIFAGLGIIFIIILYFIIIILIAIISVISIFVPYLIYYGDFGTREAFMTSYKLVKSNPFLIIGFIFVTGIIGSAGVFACYIGALFTMPISYCMQYCMIKKILIYKNPLDEIGKLEIDN